MFVIVIVLALVGFGAYTISKKTSQSDLMIKNDDTTIENDTDNKIDKKIADSRYVQYSKSALDGASNDRRVLYFYASWCPTCKPADENFTQNASKIPEDVTLIRVNYNDPETDLEEKDLAKKYGITYQHTFVQIDGSNKEVTKWNGGQIDELLSNIK